MTRKEKNYLISHFFKVKIKEKATDLEFGFYMSMNDILGWLKVYRGGYEMKIYEIYDPIKERPKH